jgi:hypothetical protein
MQLGDYEGAIAVAPKVSLKYWQSCIKHYVEVLDDPKHELEEGRDREGEKIEYLLLLG